ncbi:MAG: hypothetical protein ABI238_01715 [Terrimesophilobacter sp.]
MNRIMKVAAVALAASLILAGCSVLAAGPTKSGTAVAPAAGKTVTGNGYTFVAPKGWAEPENSATPTGVDTFVANLTDTDGFADNLNVLLSPAGQVTPEQVESQGVAELQDAGATEVLAGDRVTVAGSESAHLSAGVTSGDSTYQIEQFYLSSGGQTYVVTFSFSSTVSKADRDAVTSSVLATWSWT